MVLNNDTKEKELNDEDKTKENTNKSKKEEGQKKDKKNVKKEFETEVKQLKNELEIHKDRLLRTVAEYDNFRKRTDREKAEIYTDATVFTIANFLPVIDSLELAIKSSENAPDEYKKGLELMENQIKTSFQKLCVTESGEVGEQFDPNFHNAVSHIDDENQGENIIVEVFQKGYVIKDKVIRHAMVKVAN